MILARIEPLANLGKELISSENYTAILGLVPKDFQRRKWINIKFPMILIKPATMGKEVEMKVLPANVDPKNPEIYLPASGIIVIKVTDEEESIRSHKQLFLEGLRKYSDQKT